GAAFVDLCNPFRVDATGGGKAPGCASCGRNPGLSSVTPLGSGTCNASAVVGGTWNDRDQAFPQLEFKRLNGVLRGSMSASPFPRGFPTSAQAQQTGAAHSSRRRIGLQGQGERPT